MLSVSGAVNTERVTERPVIGYLVETKSAEKTLGRAITMPRVRTVKTIRKSEIDEVGVLARCAAADKMRVSTQSVLISSRSASTRYRMGWVSISLNRNE